MSCSPRKSRLGAKIISSLLIDIYGCEQTTSSVFCILYVVINIKNNNRKPRKQIYFSNDKNQSDLASRAVVIEC